MWSGVDDGGLLLRPDPLSLRNPAPRRLSGEGKVNMATDNLMGATVRIRRGWHGGRTGEVVAYDHQVGPPSSYTVIEVQLKGNRQPVTVYSLDDIERLPDSPGVSELPTTPPELPKVI